MAKNQTVKPKGKRIFIGDLLGLPYAPVVEQGPLIPPGLVVFPLPQDVKGATCGDGRACALSRAISRMQGFKNDVHANVGQRFAHIPLKVPVRGEIKTIIAKMQATSETRKAIAKFDKTGKMPEAGFRFVPIAQSHTYKARAIYSTLRAGELANGATKRKYVRKNKRSNHLRSIAGLVSAAPRFTV